MRRARNGDIHHDQSQNQNLTRVVYIYLSIFARTFVRAWPIANRVGGHRWPEVLRQARVIIPASLQNDEPSILITTRFGLESQHRKAPGF